MIAPSNSCAGWLAIGLLALTVFAGCGNNRAALEGTVELDGLPLKDGEITFTPQPGSNGPTAGGRILNGKFIVAPKMGVQPGMFRVEILATQKTGRTVTTPWGAAADEIISVIPSRYNTNSEL